MRSKTLLTLLLFFLSAFVQAETKITFEKLSGFSTLDQRRVIKIAQNLETVINSEHFMLLVFSHQYNNEKTFFQNNNETNDQIFYRLMSGYERRNPLPDNTWSLNLRLRSLFSRTTTAYTYPSSPVITISLRYWKKTSEAGIARTLCHEYLHKVGYDHSSSRTVQRPFTVPYGIGGICETVYANIINQ